MFYIYMKSGGWQNILDRMNWSCPFYHLVSYRGCQFVPVRSKLDMQFNKFSWKGIRYDSMYPIKQIKQCQYMSKEIYRNISSS